MQRAASTSDLAINDERRKGPRGFARDDHPLHGKQRPDHRRKKGISGDTGDDTA